MSAIRMSACFLTAVLCVSLAAGCGERQEEASAPGSFAMAAAAVPAGASLASEASVPLAVTMPPSIPPAAASASNASPQPNGDSVEGTKAAAGTLLMESAKPIIAAPTPTVQPTAATKPPIAPSASPISSPSVKQAAPVGISSNEIKWSEFFDDGLQNNPSEKFWDMNGKTVTIKGYMGEVLSFEKHWFLIIPSPGAECPFDNGDETFWNTIMIAFTSSGEKLRFTPGPLEITGRLDVGIKIDESGYKTMFRLYDAKLEKLKE